MNALTDERRLGFWYGVVAVLLLGLFFVSIQFQESMFEYLAPTVIVMTVLLSLRFAIWGFKHEMPFMWAWVLGFLFVPPVANAVFWLMAWQRGARGTEKKDEC